MKIVIDSYAWIEHFIGDKKGLKVKEIMEDADEVYTPGTVLAEVARKYIREGIEEKAVDARLEQISEVSFVTRIDAKLAKEAAKCYMELAANARRFRRGTPSLFDAIVLATGRLTKSKIVSGDEHFRNLSETIWLE